MSKQYLVCKHCNIVFNINDVVKFMDISELKLRTFYCPKCNVFTNTIECKPFIIKEHDRQYEDNNVQNIEVTINLDIKSFKLGYVYKNIETEEIYMCCHDEECNSIIMVNLTTLSVEDITYAYDIDNFIELMNVKKLCLHAE